MNISSRCEYACRAMVGLSRHFAVQKPLPSQILAEEWHIPEKFLVHILLQLKHAGLVKSTRGAQGGYMLSNAPDQTTLLDIVVAVDGAVLNPLPVEDSMADALRGVWEDTAGKISEVLQSISLQDLSDNSATSDMYYI